MNKKNTIRTLATTGLIAALYTVMTVCVAPLSYGLVQCRLSEALTILAAYTPTAIPGLTVGCALSNLIGLSLGANVAGALDIAVGTLATGLAAVLSRRWRRYRIKGLPLASTLPPVVINAVAIGTELALVAPQFTAEVWFIQMGLVAAGQFVACVIGGALLSLAINRTALDRRLGWNS